MRTGNLQFCQTIHAIAVLPFFNGLTDDQRADVITEIATRRDGDGFAYGYAPLQTFHELSLRRHVWRNDFLSDKFDERLVLDLAVGRIFRARDLMAAGFLVAGGICEACGSHVKPTLSQALEMGERRACGNGTMAGSRVIYPVECCRRPANLDDEDNP